jgi:hypothetical protein
MFLMDHGALRAPMVLRPERRADRHSNRDPDAQPDRDVPGQNSGNRTQRGSQRDA